MKKQSQRPSIDKKSWLLKQRALELHKNLGNSVESAKDDIFKFLDALLKESDTNQKIAISWLIKKKVFAELDPQKIFNFSIKCIKYNNQTLITNILKAVKIQTPNKEDLGFYLTDEGNTLGHLAAQKDKQNVILGLNSINPEYLRIKNLDGDTLPHIASKFLSQKSIEIMIKTCPGLFWVRNNQGLKPSELEGGPLINSIINEKEVQKAWSQDNDTYQKSLDTLKLASENTMGHLKKNSQVLSPTIA